MSGPSSIGVVIPTLNCSNLLQRHLESMAAWIDCVEQIVVVDSFSDDGSFEMLADAFSRDCRASLFRRPRGLYQSWNFGISKLNTEFTYISTVGDSITRNGLEHLKAVAKDINADVVISEPNFITIEGMAPLENIKWPIKRIKQQLQVTEPKLLSPWLLGLFIAENPVNAILGSSASNIYKTQILQERNFPTDYGTIGDSAWGIKNLFYARIALTPISFSTFLEHPKSYDMSIYNSQRLTERCIDLLQVSFEGADTGNICSNKEKYEYAELINVLRRKNHWQSKLEYSRHSILPWILNPIAWYYRKMRNHFREKLNIEIISKLSMIV